MSVKVLLPLAVAGMIASPASALTTSLKTLTVYDATSAIVGSVSASSVDEAAVPFTIFTVPGIAGNPAAYHDFDTIYIAGEASDIVGVTRTLTGSYALSFGGPEYALSIGGINPIEYTVPIDVSRFLAPELGDTALLTISSITIIPGPPQGGGVGAIPEPATWGLMVAGFGLVGAASRRRRVAAA